MPDLTSDEDLEQLNKYLEQLLPVIKRAARSVEFQWPGVVDADDVEQSIYLRLLESPGSVETIIAMDDRARYRAIVGIGHQLAGIERDSYDHFKGSYRYSVGEAKSILKRGILIEPLDGFNEFVLDLAESLERLSEKTPRYADAILKRYADEQVPAAGADQKRLADALTSLVDGMNKSHRTRFSERDDGPGTRKAISNAVAQHISICQYSGEGDS